MSDRASDVLAPILSIASERLHAIILEEEPLDDATNASLYARAYAGFVKTISGQWWIFSTPTGKWIPDPEKALSRRLAIGIGIARRESIGKCDDLKAAVRHAVYSLSASGIRAMLELAASEPVLMGSREELDSHPDVILDAAGNLIDMRTLETRRAMPEDGFTRALGAVYDPEATCPEFERFIVEAMGGDLEKVLFLRRWAGYCLTGRTTESKSVIHIGNGGNGKGVFSSVNEAIAGDYGRTISPDVFASTHGVSGPAYELAELDHVRAVYIRETPLDGQWNEALFKSATGEDTISARAPYGKPFTYRPCFKLSIETNHDLRVKSQNVAMWRRLLRIVWTCRPENPDPNLREKLLVEKSGILNWILAGARDWYEFGLQPPEAVQTATKEYREGEDTLKDFIDGFRLDPTASIASSALYRDYRGYAEENGLRQMSCPAFKEAMRERGFDHRHTRAGSCFMGIGCRL